MKILGISEYYNLLFWFFKCWKISKKYLFWNYHRPKPPKMKKIAYFAQLQTFKEKFYLKKFTASLKIEWKAKLTLKKMLKRFKKADNLIDYWKWSIHLWKVWLYPSVIIKFWFSKLIEYLGHLFQPWNVLIISFFLFAILWQ